MRKYKSVGICIYCGSSAYSNDEPERKLGDEHIIPLGIGGTLILPEASCQKCEKTTSLFESHCIGRLFHSARPHMPFARGRGRLKRDRVATRVGRAGTEVKIPVSEHPGMLVMFKFDVAAAITDFNPAPAFGGQAVICPIVQDFGRKVDKAKGVHFALNFPAESFGRFLAKIAHSYAVAELGVNGFVPCLKSVLVGEAPYDHDLCRFVGSSLIEEPIGTQNHEIGIVPRTSFSRKVLIVVRIRLFSRFPMPTYYIVAGTPLHEFNPHLPII